jgi:HEAT repeat protein
MAACSASPAMRAAQSGDRAALRQAIAARAAQGSLSNGEAASLARAVAAHDLETASRDDAIVRVRDVLACARELDGALSSRMTTHDAAGAAAALARLDARRWDLDDARRYVGDADSAWRAVGARALVREVDRRARLEALVDGNPLVRRQAARAARDARDAADARPLSEAARLDPEPIVRTEAVRALAALSGAGIADALRDLWTGGDEGLREDIAAAWSSPSLWDAGGREALRVLVASGHGSPAIEGAAAVLRRADAGTELVSLAIGRLVAAIRSGAAATRLQAIAQAPLDRPELLPLLEAVRAAAKDDDEQVRIGALTRLAGRAGPGAVDAKAAVGALELLAQPGSAVGAQARWALGSVGDRRVQAWLEQDLASSDAPDRLAAAAALADLGVAARAAPLLGDDNPSVRGRAACTLLIADRAAGH